MDATPVVEVRGTVYRLTRGRHAGKWTAELRATVCGHWYRFTAICDTKREAEKRRARWAAWVTVAKDEEAAGRAVVPPSGSTTCAELCDEWLRTRTARARTVEGYRLHVERHVLPFFGRATDVRRVDARHVARFRAMLLEQHAPSGVQRIESTLRSVLRYAVRGGILDRNPYDDVPTLRAPKRDAWRVLSAEDVDAVVGAADPEWAVWWLVAFRTGLRMGELRALRWDDLDLVVPGWVAVERRVTGRPDAWDVGPPKSGRGRRVPLSPDALDALRRWPRTLGTDLVFPAPCGDYRDPDGVRRSLRRACRRAGVEGHVRPHDARHTWASHLLHAGVDPETVRRLGGWSSLELVMRYVHTDEARMVEAVSRLGSARRAPDHAGGIAAKSTPP